MTWRKTYPTTKSKIKDLPTLHSDNFIAIEDALEYEHYSPASANATLSGAHRLGAVGTVYEGTTTQIAALSATAQVGALAYDTTLGMLVRYTGSLWQAIGQTQWSRMRAYLGANVSITADASADILICGTEDYDTLSEYNNSTGVFTALASGYYAIIATTSWLASGSQAISAVCSATGRTDQTYQLFGNTPEDLATYLGGGYTNILATTPFVASGSGVMNLWSMYTTSSGPFNAKVKVFRDNGTDYVFIGEGPIQSINSGLNSDMPCWIPVEAGDMIGVYLPADKSIECEAIAGAEIYRAGDITATTAKNTWGGLDYAMALQGKIFVNAFWIPSGSSNNWENIDEYPTAIDTDLNITQTLSATDILSGTLTTIPSGSTNITVFTEWRGRRRGCVCNSTCYNESCTCNNICYVHGCSCNNTNYGGVGCSCNNTCYWYDGKTCTCNYTCYGYVACTCNNTCYGQSCTCNNTLYNPTSGCSCNATCYTEDATRVTPLIRKGDTNYFATQTIPTSAFADYEGIWLEDPLGGSWTPNGVAAIQGFGYAANAASAGCSADVSQCYLKYNWSPLRPVVGLHTYKNGSVVESVYRPIHEAGAVSYQTVDIMTILKLDPNDQITIRYDKTMINDIIFAGSEYTYLTIHRLAGNCV